MIDFQLHPYRPPPGLSASSLDLIKSVIQQGVDCATSFGYLEQNPYSASGKEQPLFDAWNYGWWVQADTWNEHQLPPLTKNVQASLRKLAWKKRLEQNLRTNP